MWMNFDPMPTITNKIGTTNVTAILSSWKMENVYVGSGIN